MQRSPLWHYPKKCTCSVWAVRQWWSFGSWRIYKEIAVIRSSHYFWLFRFLWSPDGVGWYRYAPLYPVPALPPGQPWHRRLRHNFKVLKHSIWFEGYVKKSSYSKRVKSRFDRRAGRREGA